MSVNLLELAKGAIGQQVIGSLGGILGEDTKAASSAVSAGLPALLAGLIGKSSSPSGVSELFGLVKDQDDGILDNLGDLLGGGGRESFLGQGSNLLGTLLGSNQSGLIRILSKATGLGDGKMATVLSVLAPVVLGLLKRQVKTQGLDATGLGGLLGGQKRHIESSLPKGVGDLFELGGSSGHVPQTNAAKPGGSLIGKLFPLFAMLLLVVLAFKFFTRSTTQTEDPDDVNIVMPSDPILDHSGLNGSSETGSGISLESGPLSNDPVGPSTIQRPPISDSEVKIESGPLSNDPAGPSTIQLPPISDSEVKIESGPLSP